MLSTKLKPFHLIININSYRNGDDELRGNYSNFVFNFVRSSVLIPFVKPTFGTTYYDDDSSIGAYSRTPMSFLACSWRSSVSSPSSSTCACMPASRLATCSTRSTTLTLTRTLTFQEYFNTGQTCAFVRQNYNS